MMNTKSLILPAVLISASVFSVAAQTVKPLPAARKTGKLVNGIVFGAIHSDARVRANAANPYALYDVSVVRKTGLEFGSLLGYKMGKNQRWMARVQPMISFYNLGLTYDWNANPSNTLNLDATAFSLPVLLQKHFKLSDKSTLYVLGGMRWNYNFTSDKEKTFQPTEAGLPTRSHVWMAQAGIGFMRALKKTSVGLELHMNQSISNTLIQQNDHIYSQSLSSLRPSLFSLNLIVQK